MKRFGWSAVAGFGVAGLLFATPPVSANEQPHKGSTASGPSERGAATASEKESEARGSGQGGARPGEVTGSESAAGGTAERSAGRASAGKETAHLSGKVEKFDRENRTLSLSGSDKKLKMTDDTEVMKEGSKVSPGQIMEGDEVRASYSGTGDVVEVLIIEVMPAAGSGAGGPAAAPPPKGDTGTKSPK